MAVGLLCEKNSAAKHFAAALGGMSGTYKGEAYVIVAARGHLYEFVDPHKMVDPALADRYQQWNVANLPWSPDDLSWQHGAIKDTASLARDIKSKLSGCDEIVVATDVDPTGEGDAIAINVFLELGLRPRKWSRMYFTDEAPASLQKAFVDRKAIASLVDHPEYKKAIYRSKFDYLSMQWTRVATHMARESGQDTVLRQGRLKSAMVALVGDQLKAYEEYVKKPFFQNRFRDENNVVYTNPDEPQFDNQAGVPQIYSPSPVVLDERSNKRTAPPKLLDLSGLSSMLASKGVKPALVLSTYQKMYEAQVVSYPRTEDKTITPEQFKELSPLVDRIAAVVGVDAAMLTQRSPRSTHVKPVGAHGANRPGPNVPASLAAVESQFGKAGAMIYQILAKNYLAMLAEDYVYEQQKGHVEKYPAFKGIANVPKQMGWKSVFNPDAEAPAAADGGGDGADEGADEHASGLGRNAEPFVFEGANKRPEHPSMKWLMKQLERRDVGTGATRTSTYAEVTSERAKYPLLVDKRGRLTLADAGRMSHLLLPGTKIGDLSLTEQVYENMRRIAAGEVTAEECLAEVADWVRDDIDVMTRNAASMRTALGLSQTSVSTQRCEGVWNGQQVSFKKSWSGHDFTDDECQRLLAGEVIEIDAVSSKTNKTYTVKGSLGIGTFKGRKFIGFQPDFSAPTSKAPANNGAGPERFKGVWAQTGEEVAIKKVWGGHTFTDAEIKALLEGEVISFDATSARTKKSYTAKGKLEVQTYEGRQFVGFKADFG